MFDSGLLLLARLETVAVDGGMPTETLVEYARTFYGNRTVSASRMYEAFGADRQIDRLVRVPFDTSVSPNDYAIMEDGTQYRIDAVSEIFVKRDLRAVELTLVKLEDNYRVEFTE